MIHEILILHHSHTDVGFTHPQPVWWEMSRRFLDEALDLCEQTRDFPAEARLRWTCENTAPLLHWLEKASSGQVDRFRQAVAAGQISVAALPFNLTPLPDLEQLSRGLRPVRRLREEFGLPIKTAIAHDVNGLPWPLTQLLLDAGVELLLMGINNHFGGHPFEQPVVMNWQGADGRSLLSHNGLVYTLFDGVARISQLSVSAMADGLDDFLTGSGSPLLAERLSRYPFDYLLMTATHRPWQNDNNPPNPWLPGLIREWNQQGRQPRLRLVTPEQYLERLQAEPREKFLECTGDWTDYWSFGAGSAAFETRVGQTARARLAAAALARVAAPRVGPEDARREAAGYTHANLWAEHTWAADESLAEPATDNAHEHWTHKLSYLYQARSQAHLLMRDQLEALAGNPVHALGLQGVLVFNPGPLPRKQVIRLPQALAQAALGQKAWMHDSAAVLRLDQNLELAELRRAGLLVGPVDLPAYGWRVIGLADLTPAELPAHLTCADGLLESAAYRLRYDPVSGHITELLEKASGWNLVDGTSAWEFGSLVWEHLPADYPIQRPYEGREAYFALDDWTNIEGGGECWRPAAPAVREAPQQLLECRAELTPLGAVLTRRWQGAGAEEIEETLTLLAHRSAVALDLQFRLPERSAAEAYYLALPFAVAGWRAHYDTAELPVELDAQQLPGVCRDWQCVTRWVDLSNAEHGVTLACPDAPLVQVGGFHWAQHQRSLTNRQHGLVLGWLTNNYWNCNFPAAQPGKMRFHYEFTAHGPFAPARAMQFGLAAAAQPEIHPVAAHPAGRPEAQRAETGQVVQVEGADIVLLYCGLEEDGAVRVRLFQAGPDPAPARLTLPGRAIARALAVDTLGQPFSPASARPVCQAHAGSALLEMPPGAVVQVLLYPA